MKLPQDVRSKLIGLHLEGCGVRAAARVEHHSKDTINKLHLDVGEHCARFLDAHLRGLGTVKQVQIDEMWSFVHTKERHLLPGDPAEHGDIWIYGALDEGSRAIVWWSVGKRSLPTRAVVRILRRGTASG